MTFAGVVAFGIWWKLLELGVVRALAELASLLALLALFWRWRPPSIFSKDSAKVEEAKAFLQE